MADVEVVTIPRGNEGDRFYRYKMPVLKIKKEGGGNGKKTVILNMPAVAKALGRPPSYPTSFFGFKLGAITTIDPAHDKYVLNGHHDQPNLMNILDEFIDKYVLCKQCERRNPETYVVISGEYIDLRCKACGGKTPVDMRHKLSTYILKNPPPPTKDLMNEEAESSDVRGKSGRRKKEKRSKDDDEAPDDNAGDDKDVVWHTDTSKEAVDERRKQMLADTSDLAAKLLSTTVSSADPLVSMHALLETKPTNAQILEQLKKEQANHQLTDEQTARLAFLSLFDARMLEQLKTDKLAVIKEVVTNTEGQAGILGGIVELGKKDAAVQKVVSHALQHLYNEDVLDEEELWKWYEAKGHGETKKVKAAAKMFFDWLKNAEEDSE